MPGTGEYVSTGAAIARAFAAPSPANIGRAIIKGAHLLGIGHKKKKPLSGTINLDTNLVNVCDMHPHWCAKHRTKAARVNAALSAYLAGTGPAPKWKRTRYLVSEIERAQGMRVRPFTPIEMNAFGQQTPSTQVRISQLFGRRGGRTTARRRKKKAARSSVRAVRRRSSGRRANGRAARFVKGSPAAKRFMARLRRMPRRRRARKA